MKFLFITGLNLVACLSLFAQVSTDSTHSLKEVTISENRIENIPFSKTNRDITVITRQQIAQMPATQVNEVLAFAAGVDIRQRGPGGAQADVNLEGSSFEQTLILINGIPINEPQTGHHNLNLPVEVDNIEQIEIIKGPAAMIYGASALAGAINIVTRKPAGRQIFAGINSGTGFKRDSLTGNLYTQTGAMLGTSWAGKKMCHTLSGSYSSSNGYAPNRAYENYRLNYLGNATFKSATFNLLAAYIDNKFDADSFYAAPYDGASYEKVRTGLLALSGRESARRWTLKENIYGRYNHDDYILIRLNPSVYENIHTSWTTGGDLNAARDNRIGTLGLGISVRNEKISSTNLGNHNRTNLGGYAEERFVLPANISLTAGAFVNYNSEFKTQVYPAIDLGVPVTKGLRLFANTGMAGRYPTYTDLYYSDAGNLGNDTLKPERSFSYEGGLKYNSGGLFMQANAFHRHIYDFIDYVKPRPFGKFTAMNFAGVNVDGLCYMLGYNLPAHRKASFTHLSLSYNYLHSSYLQGDMVSKYVLDNLKHQLIGSASYKLGNHFSHTISARYLQRLTGNPYFLLDTRLAYKTSTCTVYVDATNLTRTTYQEEYITMPGLWFKMGINLRLPY